MDYLIGAASSVTEDGTNMEGKTQDASSTAPKQLTAAQKQLLKRQQELEYWKRHSKQIRSRNLITGLTIGAFVVGLCILNMTAEPQMIYFHKLINIVLHIKLKNCIKNNNHTFLFILEYCHTCSILTKFYMVTLVSSLLQ